VEPESLVGEIFPFEVERGKRLKLEVSGPEESTRLVELNALVLVWERDSALLVILRDVTLRRTAELDLQQEQKWLALTLDSIAGAVIVVQPNREIERMNQAAVKLIGMSMKSARSQRLGDVLKLRHPKTGKLIKDPVSVFLSQGITPEMGISLEGDDGAKIVVSVEMRCILEGDPSQHGYVVVLNDVTSYKNAEKALFQAEQLRSISLLAGGIAHDLNNILTAVLGNVSMVRMGMDEGDVNAKKLLSAEKAGLQATSLTQQLLSFSKGGTPLLKATTIDQLVEDCA
jgi:two-component system cell cycle sensor histidine kinase/response regulator CckA